MKSPVKKNEGKDDDHDYCPCKECMGENFLWIVITVASTGTFVVLA